MKACGRKARALQKYILFPFHREYTAMSKIAVLYLLDVGCFSV